MATLAESPRLRLAAAPEPASGMRYVARQPILDLRGKVHGYELLFRNGPEDAFSGDGDLATRTMLDNTVLFGWEADRRPAGVCELHRRDAHRDTGSSSSLGHDGA